MMTATPDAPAPVRLEVPDTSEPATPAVPDAPVTPVDPDPGTPAAPQQPADVPAPDESPTPIVPEREDDERVENY